MEALFAENQATMRNVAVAMVRKVLIRLWETLYSLELVPICPYIIAGSSLSTHYRNSYRLENSVRKCNGYGETNGELGLPVTLNELAVFKSTGVRFEIFTLWMCWWLILLQENMGCQQDKIEDMLENINSKLLTVSVDHCYPHVRPLKILWTRPRLIGNNFVGW